MKDHPLLTFLAVVAVAGFVTDQIENSSFYQTNIGSVAQGDLASMVVKYGTLAAVVWAGVHYSGAHA